MAARYPLVLNGTTIEELQSVDTLAGVDAFASGTAMLFVQTAAPTGWTKSITHNDKALRVVSGTASSGGSIAFTTAFANGNSGATTLTTTQIPSHTHSVVTTAVASGVQGGGSPGLTIPTNSAGNTGSAGGGGSHTHSLSLAVAYVDVIIATKD